MGWEECYGNIAKNGLELGLAGEAALPGFEDKKKVPSYKTITMAMSAIAGLLALTSAQTHYPDRSQRYVGERGSFLSSELKSRNIASIATVDVVRKFQKCRGTQSNSKACRRARQEFHGEIFSGL